MRVCEGDKICTADGVTGTVLGVSLPDYKESVVYVQLDGEKEPQALVPGEISWGKSEFAGLIVVCSCAHTWVFAYACACTCTCTYVSARARARERLCVCAVLSMSRGVSV